MMQTNKISRHNAPFSGALLLYVVLDILRREWYATNDYKLLKGFCGGFLRVGGKIYTQHVKIVLRGV